MKISLKIKLAILLTCLTGVFATATVYSGKAVELSTEALETQVKNQLIAVREIQKSKVENYFNFIAKQIVSLSASTMTSDALTEFTETFDIVSEEVMPNATSNARLESYYVDQFGEQFKSLNTVNSVEVIDKLDAISTNGVLLQQAYIADNKNELGNKHLLDIASTRSSYDYVHLKYHSNYRLFLEQFGFYDIFLVDTKGNVVYSVYKELDYATNLINGPYAESGLATAFKNAVGMDKGEYAFDDFSPYFPSYNSPASFLGAPVFSGNSLLGVLVFQMPVDNINQMMTYNGKWRQSGLGETGESFIVGPDKLIRSQSRGLVENKTNFLNKLREAGVSENIVQRVETTESTAGQQPVVTPAVIDGLKGNSGFEHQDNHLKIDSFIAYAPIDILGLRWVLVSEMSATEALGDINTLVVAMQNIKFLTIGIIGAISIVIAWNIANGISRPITRFTDKITEITVNEDLTEQLEAKGKDELAELSRALNKMFADFRKVIIEADTTVQALNSSTEDIQLNLNNMGKDIDSQAKESSQVASSVSQLNASVSEVADFANQASQASDDVRNTVKESSVVGEMLVTEIDALSNKMSMATSAMGKLSEESNSIGTVLDVIQGIAEQTNLLALNAAIEAARAGEQGRGFSVVADEVRSLAIRTQESTEEIRSKVESLQRETEKSVVEINNANQYVIRSVEHCQTNNEMLDNINEMISKINDMNSQIATSANEQSQVTEGINKSISNIASSSVAVADKAHRSNECSEELNIQSVTLTKQIGKFKIN
ncbi:methyl-accepting chemotaxis protein [Veronia pacifica]|uniref:Chemotaxis protein n=1 Tax=Veronia pacifica TaxID=1080227 RepID=A0A1C3EE12_9GAMM|nr:methyl-accepting chemotaxis protein [Veronia pacifica]ODA31459.1 chemotaxis protein [Veronia pacifica]